MSSAGIETDVSPGQDVVDVWQHILMVRDPERLAVPFHDEGNTSKW